MTTLIEERTQGSAVRARASHLLWTGFFLFGIGASTYCWVLALTAYRRPGLFGGTVAGVPLGFIAFVVAIAGGIRMVKGLALKRR